MATILKRFELFCLLTNSTDIVRPRTCVQNRTKIVAKAFGRYYSHTNKRTCLLFSLRKWTSLAHMLTISLCLFRRGGMSRGVRRVSLMLPHEETALVEEEDFYNARCEARTPCCHQRLRRHSGVPPAQHPCLQDHIVPFHPGQFRCSQPSFVTLFTRGSYHYRQLTSKSNHFRYKTVVIYLYQDIWILFFLISWDPKS